MHDAIYSNNPKSTSYARHYKSITDRINERVRKTHQALFQQELWGRQEHNVSIQESTGMIAEISYKKKFDTHNKELSRNATTQKKQKQRELIVET